jgi:3-phosphoshikimate 1-carboxyvinyltransferase
LSKGEDVARTLRIIEQLGASVEIDGEVVRVLGPYKGLRATKETLYCGNSGTTIRLLLGLLSGVEGQHNISGDASLSRRPMDRVAVPLRQMGVEIEGQGPTLTPPIRMHGRANLSAIDYEMPKSSAQVKSAILLAALRASSATTVRESVRTRANTEEMLIAAGVDVSSHDVGEGRVIAISPSRPRSCTWIVPGDPSQAAFFVVGGLIHADGNVIIPNIYDGPERTGFLSVLKRMGGDIVEQKGSSGTTVLAKASKLTGTEILSSEIPSVDEVPALTVAACAATGATTFVDMAELRIKESDRFAESIRLAQALGASVSIDGDNFTIAGLGDASNFKKFDFEAPDDHRMAMAASIAAYCGNGATIHGVESVNTSFPRFFDYLGEE